MKRPTDAESRALLRLSIIAGFATMTAYPLSVRFPAAAFAFLAMPLALATSGRLLGRRSLEFAALGLVGVLTVAFTGTVPLLLDAVVLIVPLIVLWFVAITIREADHRAARIFSLSAALAYIVSLIVTTASQDTAIGLLAILAIPGVVMPLVRTRGADAAPRSRSSN
ncbi:MAG: hypothetical protein WD377_08550 [Nitriliruptoraceae bacterium]